MGKKEGWGSHLALLSEAEKMLSSAIAEYDEAAKLEDSVKLRKACEAGWLAIVKASDAVLEASGVGAGKSHKDRRIKLRNLESSNPEIASLDLRDRHMARMSYLHIEGFYEGTLDYKEAEEQLRKVKEYLNYARKAVELLTKRMQSP